MFRFNGKNGREIEGRHVKCDVERNMLNYCNKKLLEWQLRETLRL
jgi:hypothetical protein